MLISVGDRVRRGTYKLHSEFQNALNYIDKNGNLVVLVTKHTGCGPQNIVLEELKGHDKDLEVSASMIATGAIRVNYTKNIVYNSSFTFDKTGLANTRRHFEATRKSLLEQSAKKSLTFLMDKKRKADFKGIFEKHLIARISGGIKDIFSGNMAKGLCAIEGAGFGLTPSGDDFTAGLLVGLNLLNKAETGKIGAVIDRIIKNSRVTNPLTKNFLKMASQGRVCERLKNLISAMRKTKHEDIKSALGRYCGIGETSGADFLTGFIMTLKHGEAICR
ncbi:DUF2877 domain-containing protein [Elusimicrobiota bacterium]